MKNIQVIDGADNADFSFFQATEDEFLSIFPKPGQDLEYAEAYERRVGDAKATEVLNEIWKRPIHKRDVVGVAGTLFYNWKSKVKYWPKSKREVDRNPSGLNEAQRMLYKSIREKERSINKQV